LDLDCGSLINYEQLLTSINQISNNNLSLLIKDFESVNTQLKSLHQILKNRLDQLRKSAYSNANKPVQRVEPQQLAENMNKLNITSILVEPNSPNALQVKSNFQFLNALYCN
jgi:hypothetical protein